MNSSRNRSDDGDDNKGDGSNPNPPPDLHLPPLVLIGDKELMTPCEPCNQMDIDDLKKTKDDGNGHSTTNFTSIFKKKLSELKACQKYYGGIGIAACQIGWRERVFCMGVESDDTAAKARYPGVSEFQFQYWINPTITPDLNSGTSWFWEGCLSVPGMRGWVERPKMIKLSGYNEHGDFVEVVLNGLAARVAQHEYDHLDGALFPNRALQGTLLPIKAFDDNLQNNNWPDDWPTPGSRKTKPGEFSYER
mmetsp:Transcript_31619/g.48492  ORF Transcript_31619/g.48492 Transcript_31619/m.48492 type:complete len:249 (-) Transcript_31619:162-908(-)